MGKRADEQLRGMQDAREAIPLLQEKWPRAFPSKSHLVKPLASSVYGAISKAMGWNHYYTRGVLLVWKRRSSYCRAILQRGARVDLDGNSTAELVDDTSVTQAGQLLAARAQKAQTEAA